MKLRSSTGLLVARSVRSKKGAMKPTSRLRPYSKKTCSLDDREEIIIVIVVLNSVTELLKYMKAKES